jgi:hypothetical protein
MVEHDRATRKESCHFSVLRTALVPAAAPTAPDQVRVDIVLVITKRLDRRRSGHGNFPSRSHNMWGWYRPYPVQGV